MSAYQFGSRHQVAEADTVLAQTTRLTIDAIPAGARVFVRLFPILGLAYDVEITAAGTYDYLSVSGARLFVQPAFNASYEAGTISGTLTSLTALLIPIESESFSDTVQVTPNASFPLDFIGTAGNDVLAGDADANRLFGLDGDDRIRGGAGADTIDGGAGYDTVDYSDSTAGVSVTIGGAVSGGHASGDTIANIEAAIGSAFADTLTGDGNANTLDGGAGNDTLVGNAGNDRLTGGTGADVMRGGTGNDIYFADSGDTIVELPDEGFDSVYTSNGIVLSADASVELLATQSTAGTVGYGLTGSNTAQSIYGNDGNNALYGLGGNDALYGYGGNDIMDGGTGVDVLVGGAGNDVYFVDDAGDVAVEDADGGTDFLYSSVSYALNIGSYVERLATRNTQGTEAIDLAGSNRDNTVIGNDGVNVLNGGGGADFLYGNGGDDLLDGGAGRDGMEGGAGADTFRFQFASDSAPGAADILYDFTPGADRIDLRLIDADTTSAGDGLFSFVGSNAFSGRAGELRVQMDGNTAHILGDVNGDGVADLHIIAYNVQAPITAGDFMV